MDTVTGRRACESPAASQARETSARTRARDGRSRGVRSSRLEPAGKRAAWTYGITASLFGRDAKRTGVNEIARLEDDAAS